MGCQMVLIRAILWRSAWRSPRRSRPFCAIKQSQGRDGVMWALIAHTQKLNGAMFYMITFLINLIHLHTCTLLSSPPFINTLTLSTTKTNHISGNLAADCRDAFWQKVLITKPKGGAILQLFKAFILRSVALLACKDTAQSTFWKGVSISRDLYVDWLTDMCH